MNKHFTSLFSQLIFTVIILMSAKAHVSAQIVVNEFVASNSTYADEFGEFDDWVELKNTGSSPVNIGGYYFSDNPASPLASQIPTNNATATTIPAGGYLIVWFDGQPAQGPLHVQPKLGAGGESIVITAADGVTLVDSYTYTAQTTDISMGRFQDGTGSFAFMQPPSPNATNVNSPPATTAAMPTASVPAGFYTSNQSIALSTTTASASIYFTLDGTMPLTSSTLYAGPISISSTKVLRAIAVATGLGNSPALTNTYFFNVSHTFPIVSVTMTPDDIFGAAEGIYPNYTLDLEKPMHFELFYNNAQLYESDGDAKIQGTASATLPQKSLSLKAPSGSTFNYALFPGQTQTDYEAFVVRNSGQDWNITMFRDEFVSGLMREFDDIAPLMKKPDLNLQAYRPGVVYINGAYWGIHNIRERMNEAWVKTHEGWNSNEIDLIENYDEVNEGDLVEWNAFQTFFTATNFSNATNFALMKRKMDMDGYLDYFAFNIIVDNEDWPGNNLRRYRHRATDGEWEWMVYDLDFTYGLFQQGGGWNTGDASPNALARALSSTGSGWPNPSWSTLLFRKLMENPTFKQDFINRVADMLNVAFTPTRVNARIDEYQALYQPEMQKHFNRWNGGWAGNWIPSVNKLRIFGNNRPAYMRQHIDDQFSNVTGTANVTLQANPATGGTIHFSSITPSSANLPWSGVYFRGNPIPVQAKPNRGYVFTSWSDAGLGASQNATVTLSGDKTITANFALGSTSTAGIVINEINYNSPSTANSGDWVELTNPTNNSVDISGWYLEDLSGQYFSIPNNTSIPANGFLILAEDVQAFESVYPSASIVKIGNFGDGAYSFKFDNGGETLTLKNANGTTIDEVAYDDASPWPSSPDGDGPTLQLLAPTLDNSLATNWVGQTATPGLPNDATPLQNQTITFPALSNHFTTDAPFTISATASSGLAVSFSIVSGPATITGNTITLAGTAGTVTVRASQAGDAQYNPAPNVDRSFTVTAQVLQNQTITFASIPDKLTTDAPFAISATASSGLAVSFSIVSGPATITGSTITLAGTAGTVTVRASQAGNAQYNPAPNVERVFSVTAPGGGGATYCASSSSAPWVEWISNVTLNTINNTSGKTNYGNYVNISTDLAVGISYPFSLTSTWSYFGYTEYLRVWVDFNNNGVFEDTEIAFQTIIAPPASGSNATKVTTGAIAVPASAVTGTTRMRVSMKRNAFATACEVLPQGEVEDYSINITTGGGPQNQIITFPAIPNKLTTDAPFTISATASSGLAVSFAILSGPATISGNTITLTGTAGTVTVQASQAGNAQYNPAPDVDHSFTVTAPGPLNQTITFPTIPNKLTTDAPFTISATASSGLAVSFTIVSGPATINGNTITLAGTAGTVTVRASQAGNAQYNPAPNVDRVFTVTAPVSVYCASMSPAPWHEWISNVTLNTINNTSGKTTYGNYTGHQHQPCER
ncbi:MAG: CotH kinase family protein [Saprospiraceae bacterium]|nr:CotH kinase family protein [Saprospiraceae bacterium]